MWSYSGLQTELSPLLIPYKDLERKKKIHKRGWSFIISVGWSRVYGNAGYTVLCVPALTGRVTVLDVLSSCSPAKQVRKMLENVIINLSLNDYWHQHSPASLGWHGVLILFDKDPQQL